jgi:5-formyltetrahydrofolate cyclo-ligase
MEEIVETKNSIRDKIKDSFEAVSSAELEKWTDGIEKRLFEFANFLESTIILLYFNGNCEVQTLKILKRCFDYNKVVVLPAHDIRTYEMKLMKIDNLKKDLKMGLRGIFEPDPNRCKVVPIEYIDIALIPSIALDEKGGRIGSGEGYYDRLIPKLAATCRKVALAYECQIVSQIPMEAHDKHVDIIITEERIIYKI